MTLVLSCVTKEYALQVSDRRLTILEGDFHGQPTDDHANKAVVFAGRMVFGYTGLAHINKEKTDLWCAKLLADSRCHTVSDACLAIKTAATEAFRSIRYSASLKRHAFVGVGWTKFSVDEPFRPTINVISNYLDENGNWLPEAQDEFRIGGRFLQPEHKISLVSVGQTLNPQEANWIVRNMFKCVERRTGPETLIRLLAIALRQIASTNETVGRNLMACCLPVTAAGADFFSITMSLPKPDIPSFLYIPDGTTYGLKYGPWIVYEGNIMALESFNVRRKATYT